ncbi:protein cornichon homolog 2-like [Magnolia sinica]|uniref:protein cornichon homolog 2-like n=1 Tax=Magnolia sinica TaxID=86752 RepID=UPI002658227F|nr:protein cornichon homolog 2-like [Magnolia sinica]
MAWELLLWLIAFFAAISLLVIGVFQLVCLSDLEFDYINPYDSSSRINAVVMPEFVIQGALSAIFLLTWHWFMFLIAAPITYYHIKLYMKRKHLIDVTEIFSLLDGEKKSRLVKLAFYLILFFITMYRFVASAVTSFAEDDDSSLEFGSFTNPVL